MPSLNSKRKVTYSKADLNAVDGVLTIVEFAKSYDGVEADSGLTLSVLHSQLVNFAKHVAKQRNGKPETK